MNRFYSSFCRVIHDFHMSYEFINILGSPLSLHCTAGNSNNLRYIQVDEKETRTEGLLDRVTSHRVGLVKNTPSQFGRKVEYSGKLEWRRIGCF